MIASESNVRSLITKIYSVLNKLDLFVTRNHSDFDRLEHKLQRSIIKKKFLPIEIKENVFYS